MNNIELVNALDQCMIRDRFSLKKRLLDSQAKTPLAQIEKSIELAKQRKQCVPAITFPKDLPVSQRIDDIKAAIDKHQVVIIAGETGSGKTTQIPKICLEMGRGVVGLIGHTQPRRVAARTVGNRIADELQVKFGESVGYQVRFTDKTSPNTHIKVMTDGILLAETQHDRFLECYDTIIIDEAHERSLNIDFLLGYLKRILPKRPDLKVIVTSATIDVERFSKHFSNAPVIEVSGRTYKVDVHYRPLEALPKSDDSDELIYQGILSSLQEIALLEKKQQSPGDVLVFLSGEREIRDLAHLIRKSDLKNIEVLPLYSRLSVAEQNKVFQKHQARRVVLATNVAETSLTVPGIRYVIDPGFARISRYSVRSKVQRLPIEAISRASADQRKGRCGRVSEGICFRLYSEEDFLSRDDFTKPEILRTNLAAVILQMLTLRLGDIGQFPFLEKPEQRQINDGYQLLFELQAVDQNKRITRLGREMARLPIDLKLARMLIEAGRQGALSEVLTIVSGLAIQDPRERPHEHQQAADEKHRQHIHEQSDFMALLNLWAFIESNRQQLTNNQFRKFCRSNFLSYTRIIEWRENHRQLHLMCKEMKLHENQQSADYATIHMALLTGLLANIGEKATDNEYLGTRNRRHYIFPGSSQFKRKPKWIMSLELVETTRLFARMLAQIDSQWIEGLAQHLVKKNYHEPYFDAAKGQVLAFEEVMLYGVIIVKKRKIDFGRVDPLKARQLFIQDGLVEQELQSKAPFYRHNRLLVADIEALEAKSRKRDILVGTYAVFQFYDARLPPHITNKIELDSWRKEVEATDSKLLFLSQEVLMKQTPDLSTEHYPDSLQVADAKLKLDYHFDPQHENDGVSLNVPVAVLRQVSKAQLDWLIPGLLEEKCLALIKSLPKSIRKKFVPAPEYAAKVAKLLEYDGRDLPFVLAERLFRLTGTKVDAGSFDLKAIDQHLRMNIKVLDEQGKVLAADRSLTKLLDQFGHRASEEFKNRHRHEIEKTGMTDWSFAELPEQVEFNQAGMTIKGYPALIDENDSVAIAILDNGISAREQSLQGSLRLIMLQLKDQKKYVEKNMPGFDRFVLFYATRGSAKELREDLVDAIFRFTFIEGKTPLRSKAEFQDRLQLKSELINTMNRACGLLAEILQLGLKIEGELKLRQGILSKAVHADIKQQVGQLLGERFLREIPFEWLQHYPRFLKAIEYRLEKHQMNLSKDSEASRIIAECWQRLEVDKSKKIKRDTRYRWMIEELRVSLFAQALGTSMPVSAKRLEKEWHKSLLEQ